jgi:hypothetical protein
MPDEIEIELGPTIRRFTATLPDGTPYTDAVVFPTSGESRQISDAELAAIAVERAQAHLAFVNDPEGAQARRDCEELIQQVESLCDLSAENWVDAAWSAASQTEYLLNILIERQVVAAPLIAERTSSALYGPLWTRWQSMLG